MVHQLTVAGANRTLWAASGGVLQQTGPHAGAPTFSPAIGTVGNGNAYLA
jgi:hypothetical protein